MPVVIARYLFLLFWIMSSPVIWIYMDINPGHCTTDAFKLMDKVVGSSERDRNGHFLDVTEGNSHEVKDLTNRKEAIHIADTTGIDRLQSSADFDDTYDTRDTGSKGIDWDMIDTSIDNDPIVHPDFALRTESVTHKYRHNLKHEKLHTPPRKKHQKKSQIEQQQNLLNILIEMQKITESHEHIEHTKEEEEAVELIYEDDIMLTKTQAELLLHDIEQETDEHRKRRKRKLAEPLAKRWKLPIPYTFDGNHSPKEKFRIYQALSYWEELTCLRFKEDAKAEHKVLFVRGRGCWSYVGYTHQVNQTVSIGDGCQSNGTIAHEVGHAIGFWHEQSRPDRDNYIYINKHNVTQGKLYNFDKRTWGEILTLDIPYDLGSDMHYGSKFYSKDVNSTLSTVETIDPLMYRVIGQRQELSFYDVKLANKAYCLAVCHNHSLTEPCRRDGYQDPVNCSACRCPDGFSGRYCEKVPDGVNAHCGGKVDARYPGTIYSPGYPNYSSDIRCSWLIKAPKESHVYLQFTGKFGIAGHTDVCKDFVEVRYNTSLALTGARFCCQDVPREPIQSDSNEMLILFHSYADTRTCDDIKYPWKCQMVFIGFKATYWTKSCGGCLDEIEETQPACKKRVSYACTQKWVEKAPVSCPTWWYTEGCGEKTYTRSRYAICFRDQYYCCEGYELHGQVCKALYPPSSNVIPTTVTDYNLELDSRIPVIPASLPKIIWTEWSDFGKCSKICGGGYMVRTRKCIAVGFCGSTNIQSDQKPCNQVPCYKRCPIRKRMLCDLWTTCTRIFYEYCNAYCFKGFLLHGAHCVLVS